MAISPEEARKITDQELQLIGDIEKQVDAYLLANFDGNAIDVALHIDPNTVLKDRVKREIISIYERAGWKTVEFRSGYTLRLSTYRNSGNYFDR